MPDQTARRLLSGGAWSDFCEVLKEAGRIVDRFPEIDDLDRAEWYRCLSRYTRGMLERYVEAGDPSRLALIDMAWRHTINCTSPMQDQLFAEFDPRYDYRLFGNRKDCPYIVFMSWTHRQPADYGARDWAPAGVDGLKEFDPAWLPAVGTVLSDDIHFDADGNFELIVSQTKPEDGRDWLPTSPDCVGLLVRTHYHSWEGTRRAAMQIERIDAGPPRPLDPADMGRMLTKSAQAVLGYAELIRSWWQENLAQRPNTIVYSQATYLSNGGVPDRRHHGFGSWFKDKDEALVIRFTPPPCRFWTWQVCNIWQENLDNFAEGQGYLNDGNTVLEPDGSVLFVLADEDPGVGARWVDSYGHQRGVWSSRLIHTDGDPPVIHIHRLKLDALKRCGIDGLNPADAITSGGPPPD